MDPEQRITFEFLTTSDQISGLVRTISQESCIAIDTESNSRHRYPERVCLMQIAANNKVYLIDTLTVDNMEPLGKVMADDRVVKVLHGSDYDLRCLDREWRFQVRNLYDTSIAARFVGMNQIGLSSLAKLLLGVNVPKDAKLQKGDWSRRPLSQAALNYAAMDVRYLQNIQKILESKVRSLSRSTWVSEECTRMEQIRYVAPDPETAYLSMKGSSWLNGQEKAILKRLFILREAEARRRNRPPYYVLPHDILVYLASNADKGLSQIPLLEKQVNSRFSRLLRSALDRGLSDSPINIPKRHSGPLATPEEKERLQVLKQWRMDLGKRLAMDHALIWPMVSLERLARYPHKFGDEIYSDEVRLWQREQFAISLKALCG